MVMNLLSKIEKSAPKRLKRYSADLRAKIGRLTDGVFDEQRIALDFRQQDTIGHQLDTRVGTHLVMETHLVTDHATQIGLQFLGDTLRDSARGDAPRRQALEVAQRDRAAKGLLELEQRLAQPAHALDALERLHRTQQQWEPLIEMMQIKGNSEVVASLWPEDEFADYGTWDKGSFGPQPKSPDMLPREYARQALARVRARYSASPRAMAIPSRCPWSATSHRSPFRFDG